MSSKPTPDETAPPVNIEELEDAPAEGGPLGQSHDPKVQAPRDPKVEPPRQPE